MSRSLRRGVLAASAIVFSIASLSACGAGNDAQTLQIRPDNAATTVGDIRIQNAAVITQEKPGGEGPAVVSAMIFNNGNKAQTLEGIQLPGSDATVKLSPAKGSGPITVPANGSVLLGGEGNPSAFIEKGAAAGNGDVREVVFQLSETGDVKLGALVHPASGYYAGYGPSVGPGATKPSATPSPTVASPTNTPTPPVQEETTEPAAPGGEQSHAEGH
ncbi:DUF461 domain-containing protein [Streptomyces sp. NPDC006368]|uniref:DUF461 domain-containing protein n=1 Tax=Streptomyces sp. NPDC006368 TaxID=3156760 RepID=UPI0033A149EA